VTARASTIRPFAVTILVVLLPYRRSTPFEFLLQGFVRLPHLSIAKVHLAVKMICQPAVVVQSAQVGAAYIAYLQLLVTRGSRSVRQCLELPFPIVLGGFRLPQLEKLGDSLVDGALLAEHDDLLEPDFKRPREIGYLLQL
jgi:hypothetical protein